MSSLLQPAHIISHHLQVTEQMSRINSQWHSLKGNTHGKETKNKTFLFAVMGHEDF